MKKNMLCADGTGSNYLEVEVSENLCLDYEPAFFPAIYELPTGKYPARVYPDGRVIRRERGMNGQMEPIVMGWIED